MHLWKGWYKYMCDYSDCVLRKDLKVKGKFICYGLRETLCADGVKCPFYASNKTHYRDKKTGFIYRKDGIK